MKSIDLSIPYNHMFSTAAKRGMSNKIELDSIDPSKIKITKGTLLRYIQKDSHIATLNAGYTYIAESDEYDNKGERFVKVLTPGAIFPIASTYVSSFRIHYSVLHKIRFFGVNVTGQEKLVKAGRLIAEKINELAIKGNVTSCPNPLTALTMPSQAHELNKYFVFCGVTLTEEAFRLALEDPLCLKEDGMPIITVN
jgi:hypothetical protein